MTASRLLLPLTLLSLASLAACGDDRRGGPGPGDGDGDGDGDQDAGIDAPDVPDDAPAISAVDFPVLAHGARLVITGTLLDGATEVSIGGIAHTNLSDVSDTSITIEALDEATPVGLTEPVVVTTPLGDSAPFAITVAHLVINEIDPDTPGTDLAEFVEIATGLDAEVSLAGYALAFFNGNTDDGDTYAVLELDADTFANGLFLAGQDGVGPGPQVILEEAIQQGEDAVALYQLRAPVADFPATFAAAGDAGLIDAVIHEANADEDALVLRPLLVDDVVVDEGATSEIRVEVSIQRCPDDGRRRTGAAHHTAAPSPGAANSDC
jgi:hypothetical protein